MLRIANSNINGLLHGIDGEDFGGMGLIRTHSSGKKAILSSIVIEQAIAQEGNIPCIQRGITAEVQASAVGQLLVDQTVHKEGNVTAVSYGVLVDVTAQGSTAAKTSTIPL